MARGPAAHRIPPDREVIALRGSHRQPVPGAHVVGRADPLERIDVSLLLRSRFSGRRLERVEAVGSRPLARRNHIGREEFESRHAAGPNDIAQVERFAQRHQLDLVAADPARRTVGAVRTGFGYGTGIWRRSCPMVGRWQRVSGAHWANPHPGGVGRGRSECLWPRQPRAGDSPLSAIWAGVEEEEWLCVSDSHASRPWSAVRVSPASSMDEGRQSLSLNSVAVTGCQM